MPSPYPAQPNGLRFYPRGLCRSSRAALCLLLETATRNFPDGRLHNQECGPGYHSFANSTAY